MTVQWHILRNTTKCWYRPRCDFRLRQYVERVSEVNSAEKVELYCAVMLYAVMLYTVMQYTVILNLAGAVKEKSGLDGATEQDQEPVCLPRLRQVERGGERRLYSKVWWSWNNLVLKSELALWLRWDYTSDTVWNSLVLKFGQLLFLSLEQSCVEGRNSPVP